MWREVSVPEVVVFKMYMGREIFFFEVLLYFEKNILLVFFERF